MPDSTRAHSRVVLSTFDDDLVVKVVEECREAVGGKASCVFAFVSSDWRPHLKDFLEIIQIHGRTPLVIGSSADGLIGVGEEDENVSDEDDVQDTSGGVNESNNSLLNNDIEMNIDNSEENANEVGGEGQEIFDPPEDITESQQDQFNAQMGLLSQSTTLGGDIPQQQQNQELGEGDGNDASQDQVENNDAYFTN